MTPPLLRSFGRPHGTELGSSTSRLGEIRISPELRRLSEAVTRSRDLASGRGRESLASISPNCAGHPDCSPDLNLLPAAIDQSLARARNNPGLYRMVLNFLAAQLMSTTDITQQEQIRNRAREIAREALSAISNPGFNPRPEDPAGQDEPVRTRTRMLFDVSCTLSALLALPTREGYTEADRSLMRDYFHQILSGMEQTRIRAALNPNSPAFPDYFESFVRAQLAMLDNDRESAFRQLLVTRSLFQNMDADRRGRSLPRLVETSTELALQSMPRDPAGEHVESLRSLISLEALAYFYQVDFSQAHAESEMPTAQRQGAALSIVASVYLSSGLGSGDANTLTERFEHLDEEREGLMTALQRRYESDESFRRQLSQLYSGDLGGDVRRREVFGEMLNDAETVARHIRGHREAEPYATVFSHDRDNRPLQRATRALEESADLRGELRRRLGLGDEASSESIARQLSQMGELLSVFLDSLPESQRDNPANSSFFSEIRNAARGYHDDGMRTNVETPLVDLMEALHRRAQDDDRYAPAYHAFFQSLGALEQIAPDATLSPALRQSARRYAEELNSFSWRRIARHLATPESIGMLLGGVALAELGPILLLRRAGTAGELGSLVRGGQITLRGEFVVGAGVGLAMQAGSLGLHMAFNRAPGVSVGQEFNRIGLGSLALGTLFSTLAMGGTVLGGRFLRNRLLPESAALNPGRLAMGHVGLRLGNWIIGGGLMLGAHSATAALTGHAATPSWENAAEMFLTMALWDAAAAGLRFGLSRTRLWQLQAGPFRTQQMVRRNLDAILRRAPELEGDRAFVESYLRSELANPQRFQEITRGLERGLVPRMQGTGSSRRLIFTEAPLSGEDALSRTGAARVILDLTTEDQARVQRLLDSETFANHPEGITPIRAILRQRLTNGETRPRVWVRAHLEGDSLTFEILQRQPTASNRENTFTMDANGIRNLQTEDRVLRAVIGGYQAQMFIPIMPAPAGHSARPPAPPLSSEATTAAHRSPRPATGGATTGTGGGEAAPAQVEPAALGGSGTADASAETGTGTVPQTATAVAIETPAVTAAPVEASVVRPVAPAEPAARAEATHDPQGVTAPLQPPRELLDAATRTQPGVAVAAGPRSGRRPRRGDETVPITTQQGARARTASRPDIPVDQAAALIQGEAPADGTTTRRLPEAEAQELQRRLAESDSAAPPADPEPTRRIEGEEAEAVRRLAEGPIEEIEPLADEGAPRESEAPQPLGDEDVSLVSEAPPAAGEPAARGSGPDDDPASFADLLNDDGIPAALAEQGASLAAPALPRVAVPSGSPEVENPFSAPTAPPPMRPAGPPPLPGSTGARRGPPPPPPRAASPSADDGAAPIPLLRRRVAELRPDPSSSDPTRTMDMRYPVVDGGFEALARRLNSIIDELQRASEEVGPDHELFDIELSPTGDMHVIDGAMNLRHQDRGYSYFAVRRSFVLQSSGRREPTFVLEPSTLHLSPEMETGRWGIFLSRFFQ